MHSQCSGVGVPLQTFFPMIDYSSLSGILLALLIVGGLAGLFFGGEWLARGAASLAISMRVSPVVVGLTIVAIATSMPEMITALFAASRGNDGLAVGNIVGSNIANAGLILGISVLIRPLVIERRLIRLEMPFLLAGTILFVLVSMGGVYASGVIGRTEGSLLLLCAVLYLFFIVFRTKKMPPDVVHKMEEELPQDPGSVAADWGWILAGAILLALGAEALVGASAETALRFGVSEFLIGMTIVAIGTSLPELAASVAAAVHGNNGIVAGNLLGSNIFNLLLIGGGVAVIFPLQVDASLFIIEFPALLLMSLLMWLFFRTGAIVTRREGVVLLLVYAAIIGLSGLSQTGYL